MTEEGLKRANEIKDEIQTLETEIKILGSGIMNPSMNRYFLKIKKKSTKKNHKGLFIQEKCVNGAYEKILLTLDEVNILREYKKQKVERLKKEFEQLN